jgi:hypothetical protein
MLLTDVYNAYLEIKRTFFISGIHTIWRNVAVILCLRIELSRRIFGNAVGNKNMLLKEAT